MNIVKLPSQFDIRDTHFTDSLYNATNNSVFSRIVMCERIVNSAGLHLRLQLSDIFMGRRFHSQPQQVQQYNNKNGSPATAASVSAVQYCTEYNTEKNFAIIASIQQIEQDILRLYQHTVKPVNKTPCCHIFETLLCGRLKICANIGASVGNPSNTIQIQQTGFDDETESDDLVAPIPSPVEDENDDADRGVCQGECSDECRKLTQSQQPQQQQQSNIVLKISGVWESETTFGLTFKFITLTPC